jgi:hypothetical protein
LVVDLYRRLTVTKNLQLFAPGHHTLRLGQGRHRSPERSFDVAQDEVVGFSCHGPRIGAMLLAALVKPDLWISRTRE